DVFRRVLRAGETLVPYEVRWSGPVEDVRLTVNAPGARRAALGEAITAEVRRLFGLDFDLPGFYRVAKADPALAPLVERLYGMRPTLAPTPLEMLVGSITAQQVNLSFAYACRARLVRRYGRPMTLGRATVWAFPDAAALAAATVRQMRSLKYSTRKAEYIRALPRPVRAAAAGRRDADVPGALACRLSCGRVRPGPRPPPASLPAAPGGAPAGGGPGRAGRRRGRGGRAPAR